MVIVAKLEKVIELLYDAFEDIRFELDDDVNWFNNALPQIENCFEFLRKRAISTRDLVFLFGTMWPNINRTMKKKEFIQRLTIIVWSNFVFNLSSIEFFLKNIIKTSSAGPLVDWLSKKTEDALKEKKVFWMYLGNIMNVSRKKKLITKAQYRNWSNLLQLRNAIVHNNGVFEKSRELCIGQIKIIVEAENSIETMLINYPRLMKILIKLTRTWIEKYLDVHKF